LRYQGLFLFLLALVCHSVCHYVLVLAVGVQTRFGQQRTATIRPKKNTMKNSNMQPNHPHWRKIGAGRIAPKLPPK